VLLTEGVGSSGGGSIGSDDGTREHDDFSTGVMVKPESRVEEIGTGVGETCGN